MPYLCTHTARGRAAVARRAHNPKVVGSIPALATNKTVIVNVFTITVFLLDQFLRITQ